MTDRADRLTAGLLLAMQRIVRGMKDEIAMIIRDELDEHRREILREIADHKDLDDHD
jgi:hypothetical protein